MFPPFVSIAQIGVMVDRAVPADEAYQFAVVPTTSNPNEQVPTIKLGKGALVVQGPAEGPLPSSSKPNQKPIPDKSWVIIRGALFCRYLAENNALYTNGRGKPFLNERSWRVYQRPPNAAGQR